MTTVPYFWGSLNISAFHKNCTLTVLPDMDKSKTFQEKYVTKSEFSNEGYIISYLPHNEILVTLMKSPNIRYIILMNG